MSVLGREAELSLLDQAVGEVRCGGQRVVAVVGEPGIGKSAVLGELGNQAGRTGMVVLLGRAAEHEQDLPYALVMDAFAEQIGVTGSALDQSVRADLEAVLSTGSGANASKAGLSNGDRFRCHRGLSALMETFGRERPVALLLDDVHWADPASVQFALHLLRRPPRAPHLLGFALRSTGAALQVLDAARHAPQFSELPLGPLDRQSSLALVSGVADPVLRARLVDEARGNPLFLLLLARSAHEATGDLPATLIATVHRELTGLPAATRTIVQAAAVVGDPFDPDLVAAVAAADTPTVVASLDAAAAAGLVQAADGGRGLRLRHPLVRRAVYDATPPAWRVQAHGRAAAALGQRGGPASVRAYHLERSAPVGDLAAVSVLTAAAASATPLAPDSAAHWYGVAARLLPAIEQARRAELFAARAQALANSGRLEEGRAVLVDVLQMVGDQAVQARVEYVLNCAGLEGLLGWHQAARRRLRDAIQVAPPSAIAELALELARGAFWEGHGEEIRRWAGLAGHAQETSEVQRVSADALRAIAERWARNPVTADGLLERAARRLGEVPDGALVGRLRVLDNLGLGQLASERFSDAVLTADRGLGIATTSQQGQLLVPLLRVRAVALFNLGDLDGALRDSEAAEEHARLQNVRPLLLLVLSEQALIRYMRADTDEAQRAALEAVQLAPTLESSSLTRTAACNVAALRVEHDPHGCLRDMTAAAGPSLRGADPIWSSWLLRELVRAALATGRTDQAAHWAEQATHLADNQHLPAGAARALCATAEVRLATGQAAIAAQLATAAVATAASGQARLDELDARLVAARALLANEDRGDAVEVLQRAAADATECGASRVRAIAARELRRLGVRLPPDRRTTTDPGALPQLTPRESEVARLVARGQPNRSIATALFLSEKTVERHLTHIYEKLQVRSRAQLAAVLAQDPPR